MTSFPSRVAILLIVLANFTVMLVQGCMLCVTDVLLLLCPALTCPRLYVVCDKCPALTLSRSYLSKVVCCVWRMSCSYLSKVVCCVWQMSCSYLSKVVCCVWQMSCSYLSKIVACDRWAVQGVLLVTDVLALLVQGVLPVTDKQSKVCCPMSWPCLSKVCCLWQMSWSSLSRPVVHSCMAVPNPPLYPFLHAFILDKPFTISHWVNM